MSLASFFAIYISFLCVDLQLCMACYVALGYVGIWGRRNWGRVRRIMGSAFYNFFEGTPLFVRIMGGKSRGSSRTCDAFEDFCIFICLLFSSFIIIISFSCYICYGCFVPLSFWFV